MTDDTPDEIAELVTWQLAQRRPQDTVTRRCRNCYTTWPSGPTQCPECGEGQQ